MLSPGTRGAPTRPPVISVRNAIVTLRGRRVWDRVHVLRSPWGPLSDLDLGCAVAGAAGLLAVVPGMTLAARVLLGVPLLVFWPGFAVVRAVLPDGALSRWETFFTGLGVGAALAGIATAALAASVGLSWSELGLTLAGVTVSASAVAWCRRNGAPVIRMRRGDRASTTTSRPPR